MRSRLLLIAGIGGAALMLLLLILVIVGFFVGRSIHRSSRLAPFRKNMDQYLAAPPEGGGNDTYEKGKILPIDAKARDVDSIYFDLPDDVVAQTPDDVGLIVRIKWESQVAVQFKGGGNRSQDFCLIEVYDRDGHMLTGVVRMTGPMPQVRGAKAEADSRPLRTKVADWLKTLKPGVPLGDQRPQEANNQ
jgi:hypothetical protein